MENVVNKAVSYMEKYGMLLPGERAVAGISGGADSVCLLFVLLEWRKRYGLEFAAVHVNHHLRAEAGQDASFVEELCRRQGVSFYLKDADVHGFAARQGCSDEEAGRILRYQAFGEAAEDFRAEKIAVAHNLNDRGETMLFHLFRGSGLKGLAGILPVRGRIIRPLLGLERREIEEYLGGLGQDYCQDITNGQDGYTRNRIRHHILPYAEREIAGGCVRHMGKTAELLAETEDYLEQQTAEALKACVKGLAPREGSGQPIDVRSMERKGTAVPGDSEYRLDISAFLGFHPALQKRMLHALIKSLSPGARDISRVHVEDALTLFTMEGNRRICLPFGIRARREYAEVVIGREAAVTADSGCGNDREETGEELPCGDILNGFKAEYDILPAGSLPKNNEKALIFPENPYTKWFDYDKIKQQPVFRTRGTGDYLTIADGQGGICRKLLKKYMTAEKIPENCRDGIPVLAEGAHVLWLVGYRISEYYKVTENTKHVLQVQLKRETEDKNVRTC